jgi:hypothetical protein
MSKVDKSLLDTDILSEIIKRANPRIITNKRREQGTGNREQGTGNREQGTGNREQGTGNR